jgi:serine phosphatase RsbU (regulator of sigma subunit)
MYRDSVEYGEDRFCESLKRHRSLPIDKACAAMVEDLRAFVGAAPPHDDITLLLIRRNSK